MLPADIIAHMVRVAPWSALNALRRSCRAAANIPRDEFVEGHLTSVSVELASSTWTGMLLPNGLRHGIGVKMSPGYRVEIECAYGKVVQVTAYG